MMESIKGKEWKETEKHVTHSENKIKQLRKEKYEGNVITVDCNKLTVRRNIRFMVTLYHTLLCRVPSFNSIQLQQNIINIFIRIPCISGTKPFQALVYLAQNTESWFIQLLIPNTGFVSFEYRALVYLAPNTEHWFTQLRIQSTGLLSSEYRALVYLPSLEYRALVYLASNAEHWFTLLRIPSTGLPSIETRGLVQFTQIRIPSTGLSRSEYRALVYLASNTEDW